MKVAFLFPGQGMEEARMGLAATASGLGQQLLEHAEAAAGVPLRRLLTEGGKAFTQTETLQPLLTAVCVALSAQLEAAGLRPAVCVGHSLGELPAWSAAGGVTPTAAVELAALRGRLMAREAARRPGGMVALVDADEEQIATALRIGQQHGELALAARNAPRQAVLSGDEAALAAVLRELPARRLAVSGAWHGAAMAGARTELFDALRAAAQTSLHCKLISGVSAEIVDSPSRVPELLADQLVRPVRFTEVLAELERLGITDYVTVGPGRVLRSLLRMGLGNGVRIHSAFDCDEALRTAQTLLSGAAA